MNSAEVEGDRRDGQEGLSEKGRTVVTQPGCRSGGAPSPTVQSGMKSSRLRVFFSDGEVGTGEY